MPKNLTKTDIEFEKILFYRALDVDNPMSGVKKLYITVSYTITTAEGETIKRALEGHELTGTQKTRINNLMSGIKDTIKAREGL